MKGLWYLPSALPLIHIYVCTKFNFNPFGTFKDMAQTGIQYEKRKLCNYTEYHYESCALHFLSLLSIYKPSVIPIPFVLLKILLRQASIMKNKWLWGDNSVNIPGRIMVHVHCPSSYCHLSINQVSLQSLLYFSRYGPDRQHMKNGYGQITQ